jgi:hypothetical protein
MVSNNTNVKQSLSKDELTKIRSIISELENDDKSIDFLEPVDYVKFGLDDYPLVIKRPIDLGTIKVRLILNFNFF